MAYEEDEYREDIGEEAEMQMDAEAVDPLTALFELVGPDGARELQEAMTTYPVVQEIAMMAIQTSDGMVDGMGGGTDDEVPALVSAGEIIIPAGLVQEIGEDQLVQLIDNYNQRAASVAV